MTAVPFAALWVGASIISQTSIVLALVLAVLAAGFMVRLFMIQHDCGHGALFSSRSANDWVGRVIGVFTLTPYDFWRQSHALHHAGSGNLDRRGIGDIEMLTVREYQASSWQGQIRYRLYRHPLVMFGLGPAWLFICQYRLPFGLMRAGAVPWSSTLITNLGIAIPTAALIWLIGFWPFIAVQLPITLMAATTGVWLFYVQHQFEDTHWASEEEWDFQHSALHGSSHYDLPAVLRWFTGNIGIHHVHHLSSKVPFYRLPEVLKDHPVLRDIGRITFWQSLSLTNLVLWDESAKRLISFREARAMPVPAVAAA